MGKQFKKSDIPILIVSIILIFLSVNRAAQLYVVSNCGSNIIGGLSQVMDCFFNFTVYPFTLNFESEFMLPSIVGILAVLLAYAYIATSRKNFMRGKEHGTAEWGTEKDIKPFIDSNKDNNIILSATESLSLAPHMKNPLYNRNKNVLVIGGSGKGKSRFIVKPNLCQLNTSYIITDPKGELFGDCGEMLAKNGYKIKVLNLEDMSKSDKFNFFEYIHSEKDILILVDNLLANTNSAEADAAAKSGDDFWVKSEKALLSALFAYIILECRPEDQNINSVLELLKIAATREDDEDFVSGLDVLFLELKEKNPSCLASYMYGIFKLASGKTAKSILVSLGVRLAPFAISDVRKLMSANEIDIGAIGKEKTALFLIVPETYTTFNFIVCIFYQLMLEHFYSLAKKQPKRRLPVPIQIIGDEIANIGHIPNLQRYISTMRSYGISMMLIFQTLTQIEAIDKANWKTIVGNCDSFVYLGGKEPSTNEYVSKILGNMTIDQRQTNETKGSHGSYGTQDSNLGRALLDSAELEKIPGDECIVTVSGVNPFKSKKYPLEKHRRYKLLADGEGNDFTFDMRNDLLHTSVVEKFFENTSKIISIELDDAI